MTPVPRQQAIVLFAVFAFAYFLSTLIRAITATLAPSLVAEFGLNARELGLLAGGYFLGFALTQLPLGKWLDRFGPKTVVLRFLSVAVIGALAFSMATSFAGLLAARVLCGVGVSACLMAPLTGYRRWLAPANMLRANSWMLMVGAMGMVASTLPVQWLLPLTGWRSIFMALAGLVALSIALIAWQAPDWKNDPGPAEPSDLADRGYASIWQSQQFRALVPIGFFNYGGLVAMQTLWTGPWLVKVSGYTPAQAAMGLFWINIAMLLAFLAWGSANPWLARRGLTTQKMIAYGAPLSLGIFAIILISGSATTTGATALWTLFFVSGTVGAQAQPAVGMAFKAELAGRALSAFNLVIFLGKVCTTPAVARVEG